jgi:hypothetical protein
MTKSYNITEEEIKTLKRLNNYLSKLSDKNISVSKTLGFLISFGDSNICVVSSEDLKSEFNDYLTSSKKDNLGSVVDELFIV